MGYPIPHWGLNYNNIEDFKKVINSHDDIGAIVLEGARYDFPSEAFLNEISKTAQEKGIIIILDEITSGWRLTDGGVFKTNGFQPDIVVYGKSHGQWILPFHVCWAKKKSWTVPRILL